MYKTNEGFSFYNGSVITASLQSEKARKTHDAGASNRTISVYAALVLLVCFAVRFYPEGALAVRPFVTDDARIVYKGQLTTETYGGMTVVKGESPAYEARTL